MSGTDWTQDFDFDFNNVPETLDSRLSIEADITLQSAVETIANKRLPARSKAIAALESASSVLADLLPEHASSINEQLRALAFELHELAAGQKPGAITSPLPALNRRGDGRQTIERQARAVLALKLLVDKGLTRTAAAERLAKANYAPKADVIGEWSNYFRQPDSGRRPVILKDLAGDFEKKCWEFLGKQVSDLSAEQVIRSLRPNAARKTAKIIPLK